MEKKLALQILQDLHDKELFSVRTALEELIPELKDSGDEKTLKEIEDFILYKAGYLLDEETEHRFIKFLEKQKEQKEPFSCGHENGDSEKQEQPSLPSNLDEAAFEYENTLWEDGHNECGYCPQDIYDTFKAGAGFAVQRIISLIKSRIAEILGDAQPAPVLRMELQELINKIKEESK